MIRSLRPLNLCVALLALTSLVGTAFWSWAPTARRQQAFNAILSTGDVPDANAVMIAAHLGKQNSDEVESDAYRGRMLIAWRALTKSHDQLFDKLDACIQSGACEIGWKTAGQCRGLVTFWKRLDEERGRWSSLCDNTPNCQGGLSVSASAEKVSVRCQKWIAENPRRAKPPVYMLPAVFLFGPGLSHG